MSKQRDLFERSIRDSIILAEVAPSNQHWERVSASLDYPPKGRRLNRQLRWCGVAAASVMIALAANVWFNSGLVEDGGEGVISQISHFERLDDLAIKAEPRLRSTARRGLELAVVESQPVVTPTPPSFDMPSPPKEASEPRSEVEHDQSSASISLSEQTKPSIDQKYASIKIKRERSPLAITLKAGGGASAFLTNEAPMASPTMLSSKPSGMMSMPGNISAASTSVHHHAPISLGAALNYPLSTRWSVESGLNYTHLFSDMTLQYSNSTMRQSVEYLGLPIGVKYLAYNSNRVSLYLGAGTQIERCISAQLNGKNIDEEPWQSSLNGALAIQYNLTDWLGIYAEPAAVYYLSASRLKTIRKENSVNFNMNFGLRFTFGAMR